MLLAVVAWLASVGVAATALALLVRRVERRRLRRSADALAHDLRTPLAQIQLFTELLQERADTGDARTRRWAGIIGRESRRLGDRLGGLMLLAAGRRGAMVMPRPVRLAEILRELAPGAEADAAARNVRVELDLADMVVDADPQPVRQAVGMLLDAVLAGAAPGDAVRLSLQRRGDTAVVSVGATRPGANRLSAEGFAMDLARLVAGAHGGSASQAGSGYTLTLPLAAAAASGPAN